MSVSLYRKYRSKSLDEIVGQKGIVKALKAAIASGSISHAYLFTGPRGVGKTSIARILAFEIIKQPYDSENLPVDIIEIDAASNRGIEEIRDLREKVKIAPVISKYKVYIIDEVHMLTTPAFNALLKTLEEPPSHVVFILATTESQKLPETIVSRTQKYNFSLANMDDVINHLQAICQKENIKIDNKAIELIAVHSGGSLRDALSTLDHVRHLSKDISLEEVSINIGLPAESLLKDILTALSNNDAKQILNSLSEAEKSNVAATSIANGLITILKSKLQSGELNMPFNNIANIIQQLSEVESSNKPDIKLTVCLLNNINPIASQLTAKQSVANKQNIPLKSVAKTAKQQEQLKKEADSESQPNKDNTHPAKQLDKEGWGEILENIRSTHNTVYSVLRMAEIDITKIKDGILELRFEFPFHVKRINEQKNSELIKNRIAELGYGNLKIVTNATNNSKNTEPILNDKEPSNDVLGNIRNVFGSAEVME